MEGKWPLVYGVRRKSMRQVQVGGRVRLGTCTAKLGHFAGGI